MAGREPPAGAEPPQPRGAGGSRGSGYGGGGSVCPFLALSSIISDTKGENTASRRAFFLPKEGVWGMKIIVLQSPPSRFTSWGGKNKCGITFSHSENQPSRLPASLRVGRERFLALKSNQFCYDYQFPVPKKKGEKKNHL